MSALRELHRPVDDRYVQKASGKCVCIFDFDETLRVWKGNNGDTPAADGQGIIRKCKVGVAEAGLGMVMVVFPTFGLHEGNLLILGGEDGWV